MVPLSGLPPHRPERVAKLGKSVDTPAGPHSIAPRAPEFVPGWRGLVPRPPRHSVRGRTPLPESAPARGGSRPRSRSRKAGEPPCDRRPSAATCRPRPVRSTARERSPASSVLREPRPTSTGSTKMYRSPPTHPPPWPALNPPLLHRCPATSPYLQRSPSYSHS